MKKPITSREDVELLVNSFYEKVKTNPIIGPIFSDVVKVDWDEHLPKMYDFWAGVLLGERGYSGNPMVKHIALSKLTDMTNKEFDEWLAIFTETVDELFEGETADDAKYRATNIARLMLFKIESR